MSTFVHANLLNPIKPQIQTRRDSGRLVGNSVRCEASTESVATKNRQVKLSNGNDSVEISRVLNGMWQTSGGWGTIDRYDAVEAMLRYADSGLTTFDMADHWGADRILHRLHVPKLYSKVHPFCSLSRAKIMAEILPNFSYKLAFTSVRAKTRTINGIGTIILRPISCVATQGGRSIVVKNGEDSLDVCRVVNGMWQTSGGWGKIDKDNAVDAMLRYADAGLATFDMADIYGPAEDLYGIFINRVRRERPPELLENIRGLTKWVPSPVKMTRSYVEKSIDVSRKRMDVACLDMLQFHWWDYSNSGYLDALKHLTDLKDEGKIKTVALTNFDTQRLQIILENGIPVVSNQVQHSIVDMRPQQRMAELCQQTGVKLITYGTVMGGLLSEKFLDTNLTIPFAGPPINTPSLQKYRRMVDAWGGWSPFQTLLQVLNKIARKHGVSISTVAVRYILDQPAVAGSMIGVKLGLSEHIKDANAIFSLALDEEDLDCITEVSKRGKDLMRVIGDCGDEYRRA